MNKRRAVSVPDWVTQALPPMPGERKPMTALAAAELKNGDWAVATATTLLVMSLKGVAVDLDCDRVDNVSTDNETDTNTVNRVDGKEPLRLNMAYDPEARFATTLRERVQTRVVMSKEIDVAPGVP